MGRTPCCDKSKVKKGIWSPDEDAILKNYLNKWSVIASHLSGRTDNEIKNYWNSKIKKKLKATNSSSNVAAATSIVDEVTNFPVPENVMANGLNANANQPVFLLEGFKYCSSVNNNTSLFSQTQQDSNLFNSPSFGMDENYGVKGFQMDEYSYEILSNFLSSGSPLN
ncbi:hypothetical protein RD792_008543 [Penstemon davidsonii]|uniref:Uncharacterized protein n=1 Tax=Penstemon davidsonii TaxID=160366 RepID=A0ABR0D9I5_9LAMI|nr:hypothetical protein RD792_008543 [Penstemon davidsonii]